MLYIHEKVLRAKKQLGIIRRALHLMQQPDCLLKYKPLCLLYLEYACAV